MTLIQPAYVTFEQAKLLKEKGFNLECENFYRKEKYGKKFYLTTGIEYDSDRNCIWDWNLNGGQSGNLSKVIPYPNENTAIYYSAPEQWQVVEWLRINHGIWISVDNLIDNRFYFSVRHTNTNNYASRTGCNEEGYSLPQEAYSAAFDYVLNNLI